MAFIEQKSGLDRLFSRRVGKSSLIMGEWVRKALYTGKQNVGKENFQKQIVEYKYKRVGKGKVNFPMEEWLIKMAF